jgi:hypothetical protein
MSIGHTPIQCVELGSASPCWDQHEEQKQEYVEFGFHNELIDNMFYHFCSFLLLNHSKIISKIITCPSLK